MQAEIITIGDEILIGQILDTNSREIAQYLNLIGIKVARIKSVSDQAKEIESALEDIDRDTNVVLITGGLGPTKDDITKKTLAKYFGSKKMLTHKETLSFIEERFAKRGYSMTELNRQQAEVPDNCIVVPNIYGTAPGMWFEQEETIFISMPGVPYEMREMLPKVGGLLGKRFNLNVIFHKTLMTFGIPESMLAEIIEDWENNLPEHIKLAYLPDMENGVKLRLSGSGVQKEILEKEVDYRFEKLIGILGEQAYAFAPDNLESSIGKLLKKSGASLSLAESCTGGRISYRITSVPGSSSYYKGGVTSYSNESKVKILGVNPEHIQKYGAVSEQVAVQMAEGVKKLLGTDFAVGITGIAGPDGGSEEKPVGFCWIAISTPEGTKAFNTRFVNDRAGNVAGATSYALNLLRLSIFHYQDNQ